MIDVKEFRIGNWVQLNNFPIYVAGEPRKINFIEQTDNIYYLRVNDEPFTLNQITPILIEDEILLEAGFRRINAGIKEMGIFPAYVLNGIIIVYFYGLYIYPKGEGVNIKHVHELQNLYFALTGTELEIKL